MAKLLQSSAIVYDAGRRGLRCALVAFAVALTASPVAAQDTIVFGDSVYMYEDTVVPNSFCNRVCNYYLYDLTEGYPIAKRYYSEHEQLVYGVAVAISNYIYFHDSTGSINPVYTDSMDNVVNQRRRPDCFIASLYQKTSNGLTLVDTAQWRYPPVERIVKYTVPNMRTDCGPYSFVDTLTSYAHMFEFYFKEPHSVHDTFYVGKHEKAERYLSGDPSCAFADKDSIIVTDFYDWVIPDTGSSDNWIYFTSEDNLNDYVRGFRPVAEMELNMEGFSNIFSYIHPILQPRMDRCFAPGKPWMTARTGTTATFEWGQIDDSAQLAIGDYLGDPDTMAAIALGPGSTGHTVAGLEPGSYHGAWLRQRCHWQLQEGDSARWSDWSERVIFSTDLEGVAAAEPVQMSVYPNPARGSFTVETDAQQARLVLYDLHGTELYAVGLRSARTTIGIADLPRGVYFLVLTTPHGTATRRLVNEGAF